MIRKTLVALLILTVTCQAAFAADVDQNVVTRAVSIIGTEESNHNYACAVTDTNGKSSLGFMQWNGSRAAALLKSIIAADKSGAAEILGEELLEKLSIATGCALSKGELAVVKVLLKSSAGVKMQDEKAKNDVSAYVRKAMSLGIADKTALCYYCDIVHQVGTGAITKYHVLASELAGGYPMIKLEHLYKAALNYATYTKARRTRVYEKLLKNPVVGGGETQTDEEQGELTILTKGPVELPRYEKTAIRASLENSDDAVLWKSSSVAIARVNKKGVVRGIKRGRVKITAYTLSGLKDSIIVNVVRAAG